MSHEDRNHDHTVFVGDLDENVDESLLWELMIQVGPVVSVYIPRDKLTKEHSHFGFVEFQSEADVEYACKIMQGINLFNQPIRVSRSGRDRKLFDIGANLFIGNLAPEIDDKVLTETFKQFGSLIGPAKVMRDDTGGSSKGYAFIFYDSFEAADAAIAAMNGNFFGGRRISVAYAFKKDKPGERHGDAAERLLASKNPVLKHRKELQAQQQQNNPATPASAPPSFPPVAAPPFSSPPGAYNAPPPFNPAYNQYPPPYGAPPMAPGFPHAAPPFGSPPAFYPAPQAPYGAPPMQYHPNQYGQPYQYPR